MADYLKTLYVPIRHESDPQLLRANDKLLFNAVRFCVVSNEGIQTLNDQAFVVLKVVRQTPIAWDPPEPSPEITRTPLFSGPPSSSLPNLDIGQVIEAPKEEIDDNFHYTIWEEPDR